MYDLTDHLKLVIPEFESVKQSGKMSQAEIQIKNLPAARRAKSINISIHKEDLGKGNGVPW